ncbi:MAG: asparagine synthetase B [Thalassobaculales bacterium]
MTLFLGAVHLERLPEGWGPGFRHIVAAISGEPEVWTDGRALLVQHSVATTPEAEGERLPCGLAGGAAGLAFDGRLDNREDLIAALGLPAALRGPADGALLAAAWERWREDAPARLLGDFALAVWDGRAGRLTLACDQTTGGRPLYWHAAPGHILFANDLAALLAVPWVPREADPTALALLSLRVWPGHGRSFFRQIGQLPAAGRLGWSGGAPRVDRYWQPDWSRRLRLRRDGDYVEAGRELLDRAVAAHCRVRGPLVCQLSGGLDSAAVVATAARLLPGRRLTALTAVPDPAAALPAPGRHAFFDEGARAAAVAAAYPNIAHQSVPAEPMAAEELDPVRLFAATAVPLRSAVDLSWYAPLHRRVGELGAGVALVGMAGNLTLSHSGLAGLPDLARSGRFAAFFAEVAALRRWRHMPPAWRLALAAMLPGIGGVLGRWRGRPAGGPPALLRAAVAQEMPWEDLPWADLPGGRPATARLRHLVPLFYATVEGRRLAAIHRRRRFATETRDPLGYLPLLEFCLAVPQAQYLKGGVPRLLARRVLADRLPPLTIGELGKGRQCPEYLHRAAAVRERVMVELAALDRCPLADAALDLAALRAVLEPWASGPCAAGGAADAGRLRQALLGLHLGQYLRWVAEGCPGLPAWKG